MFKYAGIDLRTPKRVVITADAQVQRVLRSHGGVPTRRQTSIKRRGSSPCSTETGHEHQLDDTENEPGRLR